MQSENLDRTKRNYEKRKERYWEDDIFKIRSDKKGRILKEINQASEKYQTVRENDVEMKFESMSVQELKNILIERGIKTKLKKKEKLIALLEES